MIHFLHCCPVCVLRHLQYATDFNTSHGKRECRPLPVTLPSMLDTLRPGRLLAGSSTCLLYLCATGVATFRRG
uniref:Uncharacterized protein n=1 Tax=Anguilla anguilla TaxID=7936 RepID=A0A0E9XWC3_ANGAN